jgi:hypothetical protein
MVALPQHLALHNACTVQFTAVHNRQEFLFACEREIQCNTDGSYDGNQNKKEILQKVSHIYTKILK